MKDSGFVIVFKIMKWCVKMILVITGIIPLARCGSGYNKKDGKITFNGKEITDKNFVVLSEEFAKDSTTAYYKEYPLSGAEVASFVAVDEHYAKDKKKVYYCDEYREGQNYYLTKKQHCFMHKLYFNTNTLTKTCILKSKTLKYIKETDFYSILLTLV